MPCYNIRRLKSIFKPSGRGVSRSGCGPKESDIQTIKTDASPSAAHCCQKHAMYPKTVSAAACPKIHASLAVVKDSDDSYRDFRRSMLQMIFEKKIYSRDDLQQLLDCFLQLNSPLHHEVIVRAFMDIWNFGGDAAARVSPV